jgi:hypothetical protein
LTQILGSDCPFKFPKPSALIRHLLEVFTEKDDLILDSCAGSGTTGHAALSLGIEGGPRPFVLIQQPFDNKDFENDNVNIAQSVTQPRLERIIDGYSYRKRKTKNGNGVVKVAGLGGSFTYVRVGPRLFGEYKIWGEVLPSHEDLAKYIFYTETSHEFQSKNWDKQTNRIGEHKGTAYYLIYDPTKPEGAPCDTEWLKMIGAVDPCKRLVVYCDKIWMHREDRELWEQKFGKSLRTMQLPMGLK